MTSIYERRGLAKLKRTTKTVRSLFIFIIIFSTIFVLFVIYKDITKSTSLMTYCYAFFAGNAIAANGMFSLGRSNIIIKRNNYETDKKIHYLGFYYLIAAIIGLSTCGIAYMFINITLPSTAPDDHNIFVFLTLSFFLTTSISFSFLATFNFLIFTICEMLNLNLKE